MATIINNQDFTLTPEQQQTIRNGAANMGYDTVVIDEKFEDQDEENVWYIPVMDEEGEFLFNINEYSGLICH